MHKCAITMTISHHYNNPNPNTYNPKKSPQKVNPKSRYNISYSEARFPCYKLNYIPGYSVKIVGPRM